MISSLRYLAPVLLGVTLMFSHSALGRIGETRAESNKRYGTPAGETSGGEVLGMFGPADSTVIYVIGALQIEAFFWKEKTCRIRYTKVDSSVLDDADVAQLLKSEAGAMTWVTTSPEFASKHYMYDSAWRRSDGKILVGKFILFMDFFDVAYFREWSKPKSLPGNL